MAGFSTGTAWVAGETTGVTAAGTTTSLPVDSMTIGAGSAVPTAAPAGVPIYQDTDNDDLYAWTGAAWIGPYATAT